MLLLPLDFCDGVVLSESMSLRLRKMFQHLSQHSEGQTF